MTGLQRPSQATLASYGCSAEQWTELRDLGLQMIRDGLSKECTPIRAFGHQRNAAIRKRNIAWQLTLGEWWAIWVESGRWPERGLGRGYMMCRKGDIGPYSIDNVFIGPGVENLSAAAKKCDLPIGVARTAKGKAKPFRAYCNIGGKQRHLGVFSTVDEARAAYLGGLARDLALKALAA
jgi:hypothetical protein